MSEKFNVHQEIEGTPLSDRIYRLRESINEKRRFELLDSVVTFDKMLKAQVVARYGDTKILQKIKAWQALVGGSLEEETVSDEQKEFVENLIIDFVESLENKI